VSNSAKLIIKVENAYFTDENAHHFAQCFAIIMSVSNSEEKIGRGIVLFQEKGGHLL